ncbi:MAG: response regulator [Planctomycetes bacterium]|nr:response regulator [Planctomycetota bacterium]
MSSTKKNTILIADDEPPSVKALQIMLADAGYDTLTAADGAGALSVAASERPDVILLDVKMPNMNGIEACTQLKADPVLSHIPVLMVSSRNSREDIIAGLEAGAMDYIPKPFDAAVLLVRVRNAIRYRDSLVEAQLANAQLQEAKEDLRSKSTVLADCVVALTHSQERLMLTLHSIGDAVIATDMQGRITLMNPKAEQLTGCALAEVVGRCPDEVFRIVDGDAAGFLRNPARAEYLCAGEAEDVSNATLIAMDGTRYPIDTGAAPIRHADGRLVGTVVVLRDAGPEKRRIEEQEAVQQRLNEALAELQLKMRELETFNRLAMGRELRMIELKNEVNVLLQDRDLPAKYNVETEPPPDEGVTALEQASSSRES